MTHAEFTRDQGTFRSVCPGELKQLDEYPDAITTPSGPYNRTITLFGCGGCGHFLSWSEGRVLNCYPPPPARIVEALAEQLGTRERT